MEFNLLERLEKVKDKKPLGLKINVDFEENGISSEKNLLDIYNDIEEPKSNSIHNLFIKKEIKEECLPCEIDESLALPDKIKDIFKPSEDYYRFGVIQEYSFLHSLLCIFDVMYSSYTLKNRIKEVDNLYNKLLFDIPKMFDRYKYQKIGCRKDFMQNKLSTVKKTDRWVQKYVSNYYQLNIVIIKLTSMKYYFCDTYNDSLKCVYLLEISDNVFEPIMNERGILYHNITISKWNEILDEENMEEKKIMEVAYNGEEEKVLKIKLLKKMKVNDIFEICDKLDINILEGTGKKKKRKELLIEDIIHFMNE